MAQYQCWAPIPAGRVPEAMRALQSVADANDTCLAATLAMMHAHKQSSTVDRDAIANLEVGFKYFCVDFQSQSIFMLFLNYY